MPNSLISLIDSDEEMTAERILDAIGKVPYMKHQYRWSVEAMRSMDEDGAVRMLVGYSGIKRLSDHRISRLSEAVGIVRGMPEQKVRLLPDKLDKKQAVAIPAVGGKAYKSGALKKDVPDF